METDRQTRQRRQWLGLFLIVAALPVMGGAASLVVPALGLGALTQLTVDFMAESTTLEAPGVVEVEVRAPGARVELVPQVQWWRWTPREVALALLADTAVVAVDPDGRVHRVDPVVGDPPVIGAFTFEAEGAWTVEVDSPALLPLSVWCRRCSVDDDLGAIQAFRTGVLSLAALGVLGVAGGVGMVLVGLGLVAGATRS